MFFAVAYFTYELSGGLRDSLEAKQVVTIPFRVTSVQSPDQSEGGGGGGCERYADPTKIKYQYTCPAGQVFEGTAFVMLIYDNGQCTVSGTTGGGTVGDVVWNLGGGTGGGGSVSAPAAAPSKIEGVKCFPFCDRKENFCEECQAARKETNQNNSTKTHSAVNTVMREYNRDATDLGVKVPGGRVEVKRWFYDNKWWFEHERNGLSFTLNALGTGIESINKGGVTYRSLSTDSGVFTHDVYRITKEAAGWRWEANSGNWKEYDENGRVTAYGNRSGAMGKLLYEAGENGKLIGYADRNDNQVLWIEYNGDLISAVYDVENRRVEYSYTNGLLTGVKDVLDHDTVFEYDGDGRITKTIDTAGREFIVTYDTYGNPASVVDGQGKGHFFEFDYNSAKKEFYARIRTSAGMIKEVWYDKNGDTKRVDVNGRTIQSIAKDGRNLIITDESGHVTRKEFDEWDNLVKVIYPH